jgi:hypothetical protein
MRITPIKFCGATLATLLLAPCPGGAAPQMNAADMSIPMPMAPEAPPAHIESELPGIGMPEPAASGSSSGGLPEIGGSGNDAIQIRKLPGAADQPGIRADAPTQSQRPTEHSENGVRWVCGGIGQEESSRLKQEAKNYAMMLTFSALDGSYLADVKVRIVDSRNRPLLETTCDGPILLIDPPGTGTYRITASSDGATLKRTVAIISGQHGKSVAMVWRDRPSKRGPDVTEPEKRQNLLR